MINYIKADLLRVLTKKSRILFLAACVACGLAILYFSGTRAKDMYGSLFTAISLMPMLVGIVEIPVLFGDEFKARSMQMAIGRGISRRKIVNAKFVETFLVGIIDMIPICLIFTAVAAIASPGVLQLNMMDLFIQIIISTLAFYMTVCLIMPVLFSTQSVFLGIVLFIAISSNVIPMGIAFAEDGLGIAKLHLAQYLMSSNIDLLQAQWGLGLFSFKAAIILGIYFIVSFGASTYAYKMKELEL